MRRFGALLLAVLLTLTAVGCSGYFPFGPLTSPTPASSSPTSTLSTIVPPTTATPPHTVLPQVDRLVQYTLDLINKDRADYSLPPVSLGTNAAAQRHAEDMLQHYYLSHWDSDGLKPYMRYTLAGGVNREMENSAYAGWYDSSEDPRRYAPLNAEQELKDLEYQMMYDDAGSNWGHRDNILNEWHKKVNIGIATDGHRLALVQQFEGDYVTFTRPPVLEGGTLAFVGQTSLGTIDSTALYFDPLPVPMTQSDLQATPRSYGLGTLVATVVPPPPPGYYYSQLPPNAFQADYWDASQPGSFSVRAGLSGVLAEHGPGVYTVVLWAKTGGEYVALTNYSIFVR